MTKKSKTVWIDINELQKNQTCGIAEFTKNYINILKDDYNIEYFYNPFIKSKYFNQKLYYIWLNTIFYIKTLIKRPDYIIFPAYNMVYIKRKGTKYYTVFHDLMLYREAFFGKKAANIFIFKINMAKKYADKIITVSETSKKLLIETFNIPEEQVVVTHNCVSNKFIENIKFKKELNRSDLAEQKYIFSLAGSVKHKNTGALIDAFNQISHKYPDIKLVLAGYQGNYQFVDNTNNPNIIFAGYLSDADVAMFYQNALLFVLPSLEEGFGIPIIEAQYANVPVLCSDIPVFHEVAGNAAEFSGTDAESISKKLEYLINNKDRREELKSLGEENAKRFSFQNMAEQLLYILQKDV